MGKVLGIICEYNPFHNGHLYHLEQSKKITGSNYVVAIMSGNFTQRGNTAIIDKWSRTEAALKCGADLVIELPVLYATSSAENFADGSIRILDSLRIVDYLGFGCENPELTLLTDIGFELRKCVKGTLLVAFAVFILDSEVPLIAFTLNSYFPTGRLLKETREFPLGKEFQVPLFMEYK